MIWLYLEAINERKVLKVTEKKNYKTVYFKLTKADNYVEYCKTLDKCAKELGVNFIGGFSALCHKGFTESDLKLVLMSATIDATGLCAALDLPLVESRGKMFPVEIVRGKDEAKPENAAELVAQTVRMARKASGGITFRLLSSVPSRSRATSW